MEQLLITLEDGSQILVQSHDGTTFSVKRRRSPGACWEPDMPRVDTAWTGTAHQPGTYHVGEY